ncbi:uncharacterized protein [Drosophila virilis]|uniref:uncharacterized protein n=1 Tax=Drosophila virilis TaxID=7244 RepID=UPI0038B2FC0B
MSIPYRLSVLRTYSGFRTVSDEVATLLAGMLPVDILAKEMDKIYMARIAAGDAVSMDVIRSERATSMATWQERWNTANQGIWTHKLIPNLEQWIRRRNGEMNFQLTPFFTGHGGIGSISIGSGMRTLQSARIAQIWTKKRNTCCTNARARSSNRRHLVGSIGSDVIFLNNADLALNTRPHEGGCQPLHGLTACKDNHEI